VSKFTSHDDHRLWSWLPRIIPAIPPYLEVSRETDTEIRFGDDGKLQISKISRSFRLYNRDAGGDSALKLIGLLTEWSKSEIGEWVRLFFANPDHAGLGPLDGVVDPDGDTDEIGIYASAKTALDYNERRVSIVDTIGAVYLADRGIEISDPPPPDLYFVPHTRVGECGLLAVLREHDREAAIAIINLDLDGQKSPLPPIKQVYNLAGPAPGAVYTAHNPAPRVADMRVKADLVIVEGVENSLAIAQCGLHVKIIGMPGCWRVKHIPVVKGQRVILFKDGKDEVGSPADEATVDGIDRLLSGGAEVRVTATPAGKDANILYKESGPAAIIELLNAAMPARLSLAGEASRLAKLRRDVAEREITKLKTAAKGSGDKLPVGVLREMIKDLQRAMHGDADAPRPGQGRPIEFPETNMWPATVDGAELLNALSLAIRKYAVVTAAQADVVATWVTFTHAFDCFDVAARLVVTAPTKACGKTRLMLALARLVRKAYYRSGITPATFIAVIAAHCPTAMLDEAHKQLRKNDDADKSFAQFANGSFDRGQAVVSKMVPVPGGGYEPRDFPIWAPQALAGIKLEEVLEPETVSRSILIRMRRKAKYEVVARLRRSGGKDLAELASKTARWATDHVIALEAAEPAVPKWLDDRDNDSWLPLFAIAEKAGADWPARLERAARSLLSRDADDDAVEDDTIDIQLLRDIRLIFAARANPDTGEWPAVLTSEDILGGLYAIEGGPWSEFKSGRPLTGNQLSRLLKPFRVLPGTVKSTRPEER
jgi:Protein of unknown function (DUF3631)